MDEKEKAILSIREFNRFYLPVLGLLGNHYLGSEYSPTEARVLFEVFENDGCNAAFIAKSMNIDKSYLSRIIKNHEGNGYLERKVSRRDSRSFELHLTKAGLDRTEDFIQKSNRQIEEIIKPLSAQDYQKLMDALDTVTEIFEVCKNNRI